MMEKVCVGQRETKEAALSPLPPTLTVVQHGRKWQPIFCPGYQHGYCPGTTCRIFLSHKVNHIISTRCQVERAAPRRL
jgi:hypothetical protein